MIRTLQAAKAHTVLPLAAIDASGRFLAVLVATRVRTLPKPFGPMSSRSIHYAEPLCRDSHEGVDALQRLLEAHDRAMRSQVLFTEVRPLEAPGLERTALEQTGYQFLDYLNFLGDLTQSEEKMWKSLSRAIRRVVRRADEVGLVVREENTPAGIDLLYHFLRKTYAHSKVPLADRSLFDAAFRELHPHGFLKLFAAYDGDAPLGMLALLAFKDRVYAWYGGSERSDRCSAAGLLYWKSLLWGQQNGYRIFDFGGAGWPHEEYGVREFKSRFGAELVRYGRYRKVHSQWKLRIAEAAYAVGRTYIASK